jgi:thiol-disulfide isomerase/thioredoxin
VKWIDSIPKGTTIQYRNVPTAIVDQMNMIFGFLPDNARVDSFFVPYYCESCLMVTPLLINLQKDTDVANLKIEDTIPCQKCAKPAELDILGAKYFKFLKKKS